MSAKLKKYDFKGQVVGEVSITCDEKLNKQMIKDCVVAYRENKRQWSANTKGRKEVSHSKAKPHKQKGTGRARQGSLASPQYKGGGVVFGPKPKFDMHTHINKKQKQAFIKQALASKVDQNKLVFIDQSYKEYLPRPKTKVFNDFLKSVGLSGKKTLILGLSEEKGNYGPLQMSMRNIERVKFTFFDHVNGYHLMLYDQIICFDSLESKIQGIFA